MVHNREGWGNRGSNQQNKKGRNNGHGKSSGYISCSHCKQLGHTANQCWNKPNSSSSNNNRPGWKSCDSCGKPGHTASTCWNNDIRVVSQNKCGSRDKMGHNTDTCWHNQNGGFNGKDNGNHGAQNGPKFCSFCNKRGHADDICFKKQENSSNNNQAQKTLGRPLKCMFAPTGDRILYPYSPRLRVVERRGEDFWAVDSDGDVLMCTICSGFNLRDEWCSAAWPALVGSSKRTRNTSRYKRLTRWVWNGT